MSVCEQLDNPVTKRLINYFVDNFLGMVVLRYLSYVPWELVSPVICIAQCFRVQTEFGLRGFPC
jgi:hypothetical protein